MTRMRIFLAFLTAALACALPAAALAGAPTKRVSVSSAGAQANGSSSDTTISANGRFVVFRSSATNLVRHDTNGQNDVFVRDRKTGRTFRVSVATSGAQGDGSSGTPRISATGRYVVFVSEATNLVPGDTNNRSDIFIRDRTSKVTRRVSLSTTEQQADRDSNYPSVSADGRFVAFESYATNLVATATNNFKNVFIRDRKKGITRRISIGAGGAIPDADAGICYGYAPSISSDGTYVVYGSSATNIVSGDTNLREDVFVRNWRTGVTRRVSVSSAGAQANQGGSTYCSISGGGKLVAFESDSTNLVGHDTNGETDVFVRNWKTRTTTRVNVTSAGAQSTDWGGYSGISTTGRFVFFQGPDQNLAPGDHNGHDDIYVHDRWTKETRRVTAGKTGGPNGNGYGGISADGRFVVFESDLLIVPHDTNGVIDIFVRGPLRWKLPR